MHCRNAIPNHSFHMLKKLLDLIKPKDYFIVTQNDHGFLHKVRFPYNKFWEINGNIHNFQCECGKVFSNEDYTFIARPDREVHEDEVPKCRCEDKETKEKINAKVRPNILFNNDPSFNTRLSDMQEGHFKEFVKQAEASKQQFTILEMGVNQLRALLKPVTKMLDQFNRNTKLIRVPFYSGKLNKDVDRTKPDERDLEEVDPLFRIPKDRQIRMFAGAPLILEQLIRPEIIAERKEQDFEKRMKPNIAGINDFQLKMKMTRKQLKKAILIWGRITFYQQEKPAPNLMKIKYLLVKHHALLVKFYIHKWHAQSFYLQKAGISEKQLAEHQMVQLQAMQLAQQAGNLKEMQRIQVEVMSHAQLQNGCLIHDLFENPQSQKERDWNETCSEEEFKEEQKETDAKMQQLASAIQFQPTEEQLQSFLGRVVNEVFQKALPGLKFDPVEEGFVEFLGQQFTEELYNKMQSKRHVEEVMTEEQKQIAEEERLKWEQIDELKKQGEDVNPQDQGHEVSQQHIDELKQKAQQSENKQDETHKEEHDGAIVDEDDLSSETRRQLEVKEEDEKVSPLIEE